MASHTSVIEETSRPGLGSIAEEDAIYEQHILRERTNVKSWLAYIELKAQHGSVRDQNIILARACAELPRSYKLWKRYLLFRVEHLSTLNPCHFALEYQKVNNLFEKALFLLHKMPRIWELYFDFLLRQPLVTLVRRNFDRALRSLPTTQHDRIWKHYIPFANRVSGQSALKIWKRYMQVHPEDAENFVELLIHEGAFTDAAKHYITLIKNSRFHSKYGKGVFELWSELVDLLVQHAPEIQTGEESGLDVDHIIHNGLSRFPDQQGKLWAGLASYWIRRGKFERARCIFEEAITAVMTVRDFTHVYESYVDFEESVIRTLIQVATKRVQNKVTNEEGDFELDLRMLRFEQLMDRRPFLLNDVLLRQNPHLVSEWQKRVSLWGQNKHEVVRTFSDALAAIDPKRAVGAFHQIWLDFARYYEFGGDLNNARVVMGKAVKVHFRSVSELANTWIEWAEMELRNDNFEGALRLLSNSVKAPKKSTVDYFDETLTPQQRLHKSWKLWSFYLDLLESVSSLDEVKNAYERVLELRIATPQTIVNYANILEEHKFFEESFKVYERGLDLFMWPVAFELWNLYLSKAVDRKISIERLRDLFEQAIQDCPPLFAKIIYLMYGSLEEERGLARHAMRIYERGTRAVADKDRAEMFNFYITKSASNFGLVSTRPIYERAISALPDNEATEMCLKFANMERRLGEIDRARNIYGYASQFCDPRTQPEFWSVWERFEVQHGNEDTFKEMLRIKRSVQAQYNTDVNFIASQALAQSKLENAELEKISANNIFHQADTMLVNDGDAPMRSDIAASELLDKESLLSNRNPAVIELSSVDE